VLLTGSNDKVNELGDAARFFGALAFDLPAAIAQVTRFFVIIHWVGASAGAMDAPNPTTAQVDKSTRPLHCILPCTEQLCLPSCVR